jgi:hypothetical protein
MYNRKYYRQSFYLLLHLRQQQIDKGQQGYGMLLVSVLSIFMFSMLAACLTMTNLSTSVVRAYTDEQNAFYVAESGLNQRANSIGEKFIGYDKPTGRSPGQTSAVLLNASLLPQSMRDCSNSLPTAIGSGDFSCEHKSFKSNTFKTSTGSNTVTQAGVTTTYFAHTFVADQTCYVDPALPLAGQSCSTDPTNKAPRPQVIPSGQLYTGLNSQDYHYTIFSTASEDHLAENMPQVQVTLQMNFTSRAIPLFQFGAFSNGDLEISSHSDMNVYGRVHANKNLLIQGYTNSGDPTPTTEIFDGGNITTAGNFYTQNPANSNGATPGNNYIVMSGGTVPLPDGRLAKLIPSRGATPFTTTQLLPFAPKISNGAMGVKPLTTPGLGFLRTHDALDNIGDYYGKADIRLVMQFDRAVPFDLSTIQTGMSAKGVTCGTTWDIPSNRNSVSTAKCHQFTTGQLRSLQQPVLVLTSIANQTEETNRFCPSLVAPASAVQALTVSDRERVLRALQIAIAADPTIISIDKVTGSGNLTSTQQSVLKTRLDKLMISGLNSDTISKLTPASIASARSSCFLPAPIQKLTNFFNRQENRAMKLLQTNIQSLTIWNRDGRYVDFTGTTTAPGTATNLDAATTDATAANYATDGLLFERDVADSGAPVGSFQRLGLAAKDTTEGGLVFHSTIDDTAYPIDTDNQRIYSSAAADKGKRQSPFGFAFNGGTNLPAPLTLASDQGIYTQGDYNSYGYTENLGVITNSGAKQPAAILADTITVLSNQCLDTTTKQLNCGVLAAATLPTVTAQTEVHAAFATNQDSSCGDSSFTISGAYCTERIEKYTDRTGTTKSIYFGGGLQNYIRMLENWTDKKFLYRGSMIKLDTPLEYNGPYITGTTKDYYKIPIRDFGYDTDFNDFDRLPPLTPRVLSLVQEVFKRQH